MRSTRARRQRATFQEVVAGRGLIIGIENRDSNANVKFHQDDTMHRIICRLEAEGHIITRNFSADCGSYPKQ